MESLIVIEYIPFRTFREKIDITKEYDGKAKIEIDEKHIYVERIEVEEWIYSIKKHIKK